MFDFNEDFMIEPLTTFRKSNRIMCDYTRVVDIHQNGNLYRGEIGYCGRDQMTTKPRYLFTKDRIYFLDGVELDVIQPDNKFTQWLLS